MKNNIEGHVVEDEIAAFNAEITDLVNCINKDNAELMEILTSKVLSPEELDAVLRYVDKTNDRITNHNIALERCGVNERIHLLLLDFDFPLQN